MGAITDCEVALDLLVLVKPGQDSVAMKGPGHLLLYFLNSFFFLGVLQMNFQLKIKVCGFQICGF